jgi:hypothetical protein
MRATGQTWDYVDRAQRKPMLPVVLSGVLELRAPTR